MSYHSFPSVNEAASLPPGWIAGQAPDGRTYYFQQMTNTSTYNHPVTGVASITPGGVPSVRPSDPGGLPEGWKAHTTDKGKTYYHNTKTGVTQWTKPGASQEKEPPLQPSKAASVKVKAEAIKITNINASKAAPRSNSPSLNRRNSVNSSSVPDLEGPLPEGWEEFKTDKGKPYYHNRSTGVTEWTRPSSYKMKPAPGSVPDGSA